LDKIEINTSILALIFCMVVVLTVIGTFVTLNWVATTNNPLSLEEQLIADNEALVCEQLKYNRTHGLVVRVEKVEYVDFYETPHIDYSYVVSLFDGTAVIRIREDVKLQLFEVGDVVEVGYYTHSIWLEKAK